MNPIQTPSLPRGKKRFLLPILLCSLAFTSVAFGGAFLVHFDWPSNFHPFTNSPGSATIEAEWIVYPKGLGPYNNFYLTSTTPHMVHGSEVLFFYYGGNAVFKLYGGTTEMFLNPDTVNPYIGTRVILGETRSVMRYRFSNVRTAGPAKVKLTCNNRATTIAAASGGVSLPQSTIYVNPNYAFPSSGTVQVISSAGGQNISYTGTTNNGNLTTSFTGCTGGTGTLTEGSELDQISGNSSTATHFKNSVSLWNYVTGVWELFDEVEFDRPALLHDCNVCGGCGFWGPTFESNYCMTGVLPPIGVVDWLVSVDGGPFVQGNSSNSSPLITDLSACNQSSPYQVISYLPNYQWIIKTPDQQ
ncbi:MAG TPA: hypothetical protein VJU77_19620 [Chthoniobacterales bacterium]|nr:hypothetical protein [Chthoniobacterales bacterium]